ncbi:hypothetical protein [Pseudoxanthomonas sp.]|uniref:hypothetical protein n=1 Tax=Pseudoxanthomonas sp. TaxID=1871049 RepID=UPI002FE2512A
MMKRRWMLVTVAMLAVAPVQATTWGTDTVQDPVSGKPCAVSSPASFGGYVYQWPEKYDQVFWPLTDPMGIWLCDASGFATFIGDIELEEGEKQAIAALLRDAPRLPEQATLAARLERLEAIYALRTLTPDARSRILRALAYQYQSDGQQARADALREQARTLMEARLQDQALPLDLRLKYLFVTANYARERGDAAEADRRLDALATRLREAQKDDKVKDYAAYLDELIVPSRTIAPGGVLAPEP